MKQPNLFNLEPYRRKKPTRPLFHERRRLLPKVEAALLDLKRTVEAEAARRRRKCG
jgi:hypothetical protein